MRYRSSGQGVAAKGGFNMAEVIALPQSPLRPYVGLWRIDPLSVGRRKRSTSPLRDPGYALLWKCASFAERKDLLAADPALAARYEARNSHIDRTLEVSVGRLIFSGTSSAGSRSETPRESVCPIVKVASEGRSVIAQVVSRDQQIGYVFRRQQAWLVVSERYYGRAATLYPRSTSRCSATTRTLPRSHRALGVQGQAEHGVGSTAADPAPVTPGGAKPPPMVWAQCGAEGSGLAGAGPVDGAGGGADVAGPAAPPACGPSSQPIVTQPAADLA